MCALPGHMLEARAVNPISLLKHRAGLKVRTSSVEVNSAVEFWQSTVVILVGVCQFLAAFTTKKC